MLKYISTFFTIIVLLSCCANPNQGEIETLKLEIRQLRGRIDALQLALDEAISKGTPVQTRSNKKRSKSVSVAVKPAAEPQSLYGASAVEESAPSENQARVPVVSKAAARKSTSYQKSYSSRCQAITKRGSQCSRSSRSGGYCWQHGG